MIQSDMNPELTDIVNNLQDEQFFYLEDGPLKDKLIENYLDKEDAHAEILEFEHNASLRLRQGERLSLRSLIVALRQVGFTIRSFGGALQILLMMKPQN